MSPGSLALPLSALRRIGGGRGRPGRGADTGFYRSWWWTGWLVVMGGLPHTYANIGLCLIRSGMFQTSRVGMGVVT